MTNTDWTGYEPARQDQPVSPTGQYLSYGYQAQYGTDPGLAAPPYGTPQYGTPQYGTPQYGTPQYGTWQPPPDYRAWVIAAIAGGVLFSLLIGMPLGLIAQRNSRRVRSRWESGDHDGAARASRSARSLAIASLVFDVLGLLLVIVLFSHSGQPTTG
jgi:Interferon-induced transmembrane protein